MQIIVPIIIALSLSSLLTWWLPKASFSLKLLDHPNTRSLHTHPIPRTGGVALVGSIAGTCYLAGHFGLELDFIPSLSIGTVILLLVGLLDDFATLGTFIKLLGQMAVACTVVFAGITLDFLALPGLIWEWSRLLSTIATWIFVVWMINLFNFMDGMDGFAAGMGVVGFCTFGIFGVIEGNNEYTVLSFIIAAAYLGFLLFNFPPATIFMGDTGSTLLGFLVAIFSLWGQSADIIPLWLAMLIFAPFVVDATVTVVRRTAQGHKIWEAHRSHYYQRVVLTGWSHRRTVLHEYCLMLGCAVTTVFVHNSSAFIQWQAVLIWGVIFLFLGHQVNRLEKKKNNGPYEENNRKIK